MRDLHQYRVHSKSYWRRKRINAYKIFGKEFRKTLPKEDNKPKLLMSRGDARSNMFKLALASALIGSNVSIDDLIRKELGSESKAKEE